jgi:predicted dehydrogenase
MSLVMRFLVVGLGSMGKRRIGNLQTIGDVEVAGFDVKESRRREAQERFQIQTFRTPEEAFSFKPDALIVSTPPDQHVEWGLEAAKRGIPFFMEASVVDDGMDELIKLCEQQNVSGVPSCTMRFHPAVAMAKSVVEGGQVGRPLAFLYHLGQYLPDWHPHEDYRSFYVANRRTGGCREMVSFELEWLLWLFGEAATVSCMKGRTCVLDADIDDVYQILLRFRNGVFGSMLIDVVSRVQYRDLKVLCENGVAVWDWQAKRLSVYRSNEKRWQELFPAGITLARMPEEQMYVDEMRYFIRVVRGDEKPMYTMTDDKRTLALLYAAERSSESESHVMLGS